jgi:hypothetical protein
LKPSNCHWGKTRILMVHVNKSLHSRRVTRWRTFAEPIDTLDRSTITLPRTFVFCLFPSGRVGIALDVANI